MVQLAHFIVSQGNTGLWWMRLNKHGRVWRKAIVLSFQGLTNSMSGTSFWYACSDTPIQEAKRPCRNTSGTFQIQYCQMMILHWLWKDHATLQAWFGILGVKTPSRQLSSGPYFPVRPGQVVSIFWVIRWLVLWINAGCVYFVPIYCKWREYITEILSGRCRRWHISFITFQRTWLLEVSW